MYIMINITKRRTNISQCFILERRPAVAREREQPGRVDPRPGRRHPQGHHQRQQRRSPRHGCKFIFLAARVRSKQNA